MEKIFVKISSIIMICVFVLTGCGGIKRDSTIEDYQQAKENYQSSSGVEYVKTVTVITTDLNNPLIKEKITSTYNDIIMLDNNFGIIKFSSKMVQSVDNVKVRQLNRYYKNLTVFINDYDVISSQESKIKYNSSYENFYSSNIDKYALENLIPYFETEAIEDFTPIKNKKNYEMTFKASHESLYNAIEPVEFKVVIDKNHYLKNISYTYSSPTLSQSVVYQVEIEISKNDNYVWINDLDIDYDNYTNG